MKQDVAETYVVRATDGAYWTGFGWIKCNYCAKGMSRDEAHGMAHRITGRTVVRLLRPVRSGVSS
jgi:hypothetical protein